MATRRSFLTNLGLLALVGGGAWWAKEHLLWPQPKAAFQNPAGMSAWLPFTQPGQTLVTVLVGVGDVMVEALIDSGAQYSAVDRSLVERLKLTFGPTPPMVALGVGGAAQVARGVTFDLDIGGARFAGLRAAALDLRPLSQALGRSVPLIIGFDVLSALTADIDFPRRRLRVLASKPLDEAGPGLAAPVRRSGRALLATVVVETTPIEVLVDTGATGYVGLSPQAAELTGLTGRRRREGRSVVLGGMALSQVVEVRRFAFAGQEFRDIDVHILQLPQVPGFPKGLLGLESLRRNRVLMDVGHGWMRLTPQGGARA